MKLIIPANLDIKALAVEPSYVVKGTRTVRVNGCPKQVVVSAPQRTSILLKQVDYCYGFIELIRRVSEEDDKWERGNFTNLKKEYITESLVPRGTFDRCRSFLIALGVIECDWEAVPSHTRKKGQKAKAFGYRLNEPYLNAYLAGDERIVEIDSESKLVGKKKRGLDKRLAKELKKPGNQIYNYEVKQFYEKNYCVEDIEKVLEYIPSMVGQKNSKGKKITEKETKRMIQQLAHLNSGEDLRLFLDGYGRLHSIVTQMSKEARSFITGIDGKPLIQHDFKCSYAFHLIKLIRTEKSAVVFNNNTIPLHQYDDTLLLEEVDRLYKKCKEEDLYLYIATEYEKDYGKIHPDRSETREIVKRCWNRSFLNVESDDTAISKFVQVLFPEINKFIEQRSRRWLWVTLMRSEAELVHKRVVKRVYDTVGVDCTLFTIHDAVLIDQRNANLVRQIMEEEAEAYLGFEATIKTEPLKRPADLHEHQYTKLLSACFTN